ncbi:MAG TPA: SDR family oxidoreductase [Thermoanaerobaculia bacterium]|nr:SDR family oxidoreductase [Thermoanaerobaculia bacterium]
MVTGAAGLVGRALTRRFALARVPSPREAGRGWPEGPGEGREVIALTHSDLDITDRDAVRRRIAELRPDLVINCAVVGVDACEDDPKLAHAVNVAGPRNLAEVAPAMVHFSSNYVFDGREQKLYAIDDAANPINEYGRTKLEGERAVAAACRNACIVRSSWIFGPGKESFISTVHQQLRQGRSVRAVSDVWASTTYVDDLVLRLVEMVEQREYGLHHVVNAGVCSNATFALEAARLVSASGELVQSVSTREAHRVPRPRYTPLRGMPPLRDWREALAAYIQADRGAP